MTAMILFEMGRIVRIIKSSHGDRQEAAQATFPSKNLHKS